jgi:glycosyltransferase involved in cell wall biosynthesis
MPDPNSLVIIIPYHKRRFLQAALDSLVRQTCQSFDVFIGDDQSPESPSTILDQVKDSLSLTYHRFPDNLGRRSLALQWNRCVEMTTADWVWLFSDDDIAEPRCVEMFLQELRREERFDLYRFERGTIDDNGQERAGRFQVPDIESAEEMVLSRFAKYRPITVPEHIFSRRSFVREGGFVDFPLAWCTDDATWAAFASATNIKTIRGARVLWREGQFNVSARGQRIALKMRAFELYLKWLQGRFPSPEFKSRLVKATKSWFPNGLPMWGGPLPLTSLLHFWLVYNRFSGRPEWGLLRILLRNSTVAPCLRKIARPIRRLGKRIASFQGRFFGDDRGT